MHPMNKIALSAITTVFLHTPMMAYAHGTEDHSSEGISVTEITTAETSNPPVPASLNNIGGPFSLTDHNGQSVTDKSFSGKHTLVFFGYVDCQIMCSLSLSRIGKALTVLQKDDKTLLNKLTPLVVTVDPENDTPEIMRSALQKYHPALLGLTGHKNDLQDIYQAYKQNPEPLDETINGENIVSHSSYFYLMGPNGEFKTLFPPILNPESMASILKKYVEAG